MNYDIFDLSNSSGWYS